MDFRDAKPDTMILSAQQTVRPVSVCSAGAASARRWRSALALAGLLLLTAASAVPAQAIRGRVLEGGDESHIEAAFITLVSPDGSTSAAVLSNEHGEFLLTVDAPGEYILRAQHTGYATAEGALRLEEGDTLEVDLILDPQAIPVDPVVVEAEGRSLQLALVGFYERMEEYPGLFIDREEIQKRRPRGISDLLQGKAGMRVVSVSGHAGGDVRMRGTEKLSMRGTRDCQPSLFLNSVLVRRGGGSGYYDVSLDELAPAELVEGIEVYRSPAETPQAYGGSHAACGAIVVWTRRQ